ncbi:MaoC/PaaZ C-terminal domain-containing protein [Arthrobacter sp. zg-Y1143]|uniref:MaoC family dehydratase n=1 Tax=Arthrobacter sp. zg-Y1143 TaxID=3049065 RepID=UPI0024C3D41B|nr:MaoC/PaaZ C-terminal domain-containing protein [Arthrobacter sp. zg-Y1143]MDK1327770.1 MaoC/PaaZ C-terminal domain-containing protein [Arthrobacter sp. zg-Y1143]
MSFTQLREIPALGKLYAGALGSAAKARMSSAKGSTTLPADRHVVSGAAVDLAKLTDFQRLVLHSATDYLPTGYVHTFAFPVAMSLMARDDFPLPLLGMVHLRNVVQHYRPIHYSEPLTVTAWAENLGGHRSGTSVELVAEVTGADGEVLWRGRSTYLAKGVFLPKTDRPGESAARPEFVPPLPTAMWRLGADAGRNYARVSGDFNPIHLSRLSAKALGMKRSLAHGMYLASRVVSDAVQTQEGPFEWTIDFESPVFLPATVAVSIHDDDAGSSWAGSTFTGWNPRSMRRHFAGTVRPLEAAAPGDGFAAATRA